MSKKQGRPERLADRFVNYLFDNYSDSRHVRRVASWVGLIVLAIDKIAEKMWIPRSRQLKFTFQSRTFKVKYDHSIGGRGGIQIVEVLSRRGSPEGDGVIEIKSLSEAENFYNDAEEMIRQFLRQAQNQP